MEKSAIFAIDFDGCISEHQYPSVGLAVPGAFSLLRKMQADGHRLILYTMRSDTDSDGPTLTAAVEFCFEQGIEFWAVNDNPEQAEWTTSKKIYANHYIDDNAVGVPLRDGIQGKRKMVDWEKIEEWYDSVYGTKAA